MGYDIVGYIARRIARHITRDTGRYTTKTNFDFSTGWLAVTEMKKNFDLSIDQLSKEFQWNLVIVDAKLVAWGLWFIWEFEFNVFIIEKRLRIAWFLYMGFSYYQCIPIDFRKELNNFSIKVSNSFFQYRYIQKDFFYPKEPCGGLIKFRRSFKFYLQKYVWTS